MKKCEKLDLYMSKGLTAEQAENLIKYNNDDFLSLDELRIKYNNPNLGKEYPEWLTPESHIKMCFKTAKDEYAPEKFGKVEDAQDLAVRLYIWSLIRLNKFNSHSHLKVAMVRICKNFIRQHVKRTKYWGMSLDTPVNFKDSKIGTYEDFNGKEDKNFLVIENSEEDILEITEILNTIKSIKQKPIRDLLIVVGYLVAEIDAFYIDYKELKTFVATDIKDKLLLLEQQLEYNNNILIDKSIQDKYPNLKVHKLNIRDIIDAFGITYFGDYNTTTGVYRDIKKYLIETAHLFKQTVKINSKGREYKEVCIN